MKIYHQVTRYHGTTGKPYKATILKELRCDFTGAVIESSYPSFALNYGDEDPCFGSDGVEFAFGKKHKIDVYAFLSDEYHFAEGACASMLEEEVSSGMDFAQMCRKSRIETADGLIAKGTIKPEQLDASGRK